MKHQSRRSALFTGAGAGLAATVGLKAVAAAVPDPIYEVIEAHRKAAAEHLDAVRVQFAYDEEGGASGARGEKNTSASSR